MLAQGLPSSLEPFTHGPDPKTATMEQPGQRSTRTRPAISLQSEVPTGVAVSSKLSTWQLDQIHCQWEEQGLIVQAQPVGPTALPLQQPPTSERPALPCPRAGAAHGEGGRRGSPGSGAVAQQGRGAAACGQGEIFPQAALREKVDK